MQLGQVIGPLPGGRSASLHLHAHRKKCLNNRFSTPEHVIVSGNVGQETILPGEPLFRRRVVHVKHALITLLARDG